MFSFPHALTILEQENLLHPIPRQAIVDAPLFVHHHNNHPIVMPSREQWKAFRTCGEFQRVLPAPITKTIQTSKGLQGFRVYSVLMSDGDKLVTKKILAGDTDLILVLQVFDIDRVLQSVAEEGQVLDVWNRCLLVRPDRREVPETQPPMPDLVKVLAITTMHFLYSIHLEAGRYTTE